ncbi:hypothetical protein Aph02nite_40300 [Actinoplanes philippinensis]|nr:hypothetical protein Aph02nite_40300 [Actinoplanes philippinensis]
MIAGAAAWAGAAASGTARAVVSTAAITRLLFFMDFLPGNGWVPLQGNLESFQNGGHRIRDHRSGGPIAFTSMNY